MKLTALSALALATAAVAQSEFQESSMVENKMGMLMNLKTTHHEMKKAAGVFAEGRYEVKSAVTCTDGKAGEYSCENVDLAGHLTHENMGSMTRAGNDIWGWTSDDGREFALVGQTDGTAFVEVLKDGSLKYIGRLPTQTSNSIWRDMKVIGHHVYIGSEAQGHGLQIFDLTKLLNIGSSPYVFDPTTDLTAWYSGFGSSHNIIANPETNTIFAVGASRDAACPGSNGGPIMLDVTDPSKPTLLGCAGQDGYCHDAEAVVYHGVDKNFDGHEILYGHNERFLTIYDVTDKRNPVILSKTSYDGFNGKGAYTHQGWTIDKDMKYLLLDDELDEMYRHRNGTAANTRTYVFDLSDLTKPKWTGVYLSPVQSIDHNQYVVNGVSYQANYASGLRVVDVSKIAADPTGGNMKELAHFDCYPEDDGNPQPEFNGAWSVYPWFTSGTVILNCIERGMFALKVNTGK
ncbi:hypothetical protein TOPH_03341 [Tolypocladium ophioglossoides CBS 100239]|uniref:Regulatory P domain-containing protein n=1 Tax=Tolypocladium ophioglossoides (strain CBS 100239) TaxID=1163406 RepID=A0A0L0NCT9_TOLOC|nr:hypothetical protein TOPH_03341 [Tolypocladium ophioglossoides CBS 100239]